MKQCGREGGQVMAILALALAAVIGVAAIGIDAFYLYWNKNRLQAATDAAALAGATYLGNVTLPNKDPACAYATTAENAACTYALANHLALSEIQSITVNLANYTVTVSARRTVPALFAKLVGIKQLTAAATSVAALRALATARRVIPIGLSYLTPYVYGQPIAMHTPGKDETACGPGCWQGLALAGTGAEVFRQNLGFGCDCSVSIGDILTGEPGAKTGPTSQGITDRLSSPGIDPAGTWSRHNPGDPRAVTVPLVDWGTCLVGGGGRTCNPVVKGFAEVWIIGTDGSTINAVFIRQVAPGTPGPGGGSDTGAVHALLIQ
jgi:Flp pilus assembly protein TadG